MLKIITTIKLTIIIVLFTFISKSGLGQVYLGLRTGVNVNSFVSNSSNFTSEAAKYGFVGGGFIRFKYKAFSLEPSVLYSQKNGNYRYSTQNKTNDSLYKGKSSFLDVPVLLGVHLGSVIKLHTGPVFSFLIHKDLILETNKGNTTITIPDNAFDNMNFGWQIGGSIEFGDIIFGINYERSVDKLIMPYTIPNTKNKVTPDARSSLWQFTLGYILFKS
jgi:hypothetical protein